MMSEGNRIIYDKAVRDKIISIMRDKGMSLTCKTVSDRDFLEYLGSKLQEELDEYLESGEVEELVDIVEVINGILRIKGVSRLDFYIMRKKKELLKGGFSRNLVLINAEGNGDKSE